LILPRRITVFGGTGFLGRRVVRHLLDDHTAVRIASRHPNRTSASFSSDSQRIEPIFADVNDDASVAGAVEGALAVVNAVSLYIEHGQQTFQSVHVKAAGRVAQLATQAGVERLVHVSGIGANALSTSTYIRSRGEGEAAVLRSFPSATIVRPSVMFGPGDAFLTPILKLLRYLPAFAMFGRGQTRLQPVYADDVAEAIVRTLQSPKSRVTYELGGPRIYTYGDLLRTIARHASKRPRFISLPFSVWHVLAYVGEMLPMPPITRNQVELMQIDTVASADAPGFDDLQISPHAIEEVLPAIE
jgi:uncharacterized protein YbjT (DUF2867 family)